MKLLIPVDGSDNANRAVDYAIASAGWLKEVPQIMLINVQWKIAAGNVKLFINQDTLNDYYREQGTAALAEARSKLDAAGLVYTYQIGVGSPAEVVAEYAREHQADQIVMGAQGQSKLAAMLLGSVANRVIKLSDVPVTVVR